MWAKAKQEEGGCPMVEETKALLRRVIEEAHSKGNLKVL
jgi:hypothetical protein